MRSLVDPSAIGEILVKTYDLAVAGHDHTEIAGSYSAKMSIPYAVAAGLLFGRAGLAEFTEETAADETVLALTKKVRIEPDEEWSDAFPAQQGATVIIRAGLDEYSEQVAYPKGEPENPLTDEEFRERYDALIAYGGIDPAVSDAVYGLVYGEDVPADRLVEGL